MQTICIYNAMSNMCAILFIAGIKILPQNNVLQYCALLVCSVCNNVSVLISCAYLNGTTHPFRPGYFNQTTNPKLKL